MKRTALRPAAYAGVGPDTQEKRSFPRHAALGDKWGRIFIFGVFSSPQYA